ncbi:MAG: tetratricopeptide repeat protein [Candidatus Aminicenantes bacterium]|nr:tetratricopeptide repeat protein [Candidatus Aminicenantes bacterium]
MPKKMIHKTAFFAIWILVGSTCLLSQEIDPFYAKLLNQGEKYFQEKNYAEALTTFEIAAFGLNKDPSLLGKIYAYMSLCAYYEADREKSRHFLNEAVKLLKIDGIERLNILQEAKPILSELLVTYNFKESDAPYFNLSEKDKKNLYKKHKKEMEKKIKKDPENPSLYYELYDLHRKNGKTNDAVKTLKKLIKENPSALKAFHLLGKLHFFQNSYSESLDYFQKIIERQAGTFVDDELLLAAFVYTVICHYHTKNFDSLESYVHFIRYSVPEEKLWLFLQKENLESEWEKILNGISLVAPY